MKIAAIVTVYNSNPIQLECNIRSYLPWIDHLIVWENTPPEKTQLHNIAIMSDKVEVISTGKNEYLAYPFNQCIQWAKAHQCDYVLTMDQDSCFEDGCFGLYRSKIENCDEDSVAIFAPVTTTQLTKSQSEIYIDKGSVYSSGSIYKTAMFERIGGFREDLAIYCLDTEICMRARKYGYQIVMFSDVVMQHTEGYKTKSAWGISINNYSAPSTYFYIRNNLLLWKIYPHDFTIKTKVNFVKYHVVFRVLKMVFEQDRTSKLKALISGLWHGIKTGV